MARPPLVCGPLSRGLSLLLLITLPAVLLDPGDQLRADEGPAVSQEQAPSCALSSPSKTKSGEDSEDDFDDVLPHDFVAESSRASHQVPAMEGLLGSLHAAERLLRPPIG